MRGSQAGQRGHLRPRLHLEHPDRVGPAEHVVDVVVLGDAWRGRPRRRGARARGRSRRAAPTSIPRPSRSNFTSPTAAQSSLSHCSTVRSSMRAHSTGHTSMTGRSQITMPPEWMPRWRGSVLELGGQLEHRLGDVVARRGRAVVATAPHASTCLDQASCWPGA